MGETTDSGTLLEQQTLDHRERTLFLILNTQCDIACDYCFYSTGYQNRSSAVFSICEPQYFYERLLHLGFKNIILTGGDPLSRRHKASTLDLTEKLVAFGFCVVINTSGAYLTSQDCSCLAEIKPFRIDFSLDSHDPAVHDALRGRFSDTVDAIRTLVSLRYTSLSVTTVVTEKNHQTLRETLAFIRHLGITDVRFQPAFIPTGSSSVSARQPMTQGLSTFLREHASQTDDPLTTERYYSFWRRQYGGSPSVSSGPKPRCLMGKSIFVADASCDLTPCFHRSDLPLGNLLTESLPVLAENLRKNEVGAQTLPDCAGPHCVSLFSHRLNWTSG